MQQLTLFIQIGVPVLLCGLVLYYAKAEIQRRTELVNWANSLVIVLAVFQILVVIWLWLNHLTVPFSLEGGDGIHLMEVQRIIAGKPIYIEPSSEYVPFVYMPLYYFMAVPFVWLFGPGLFALRLLAVLGSVGSYVLIYKIISSETASRDWGIVAVGLVAGSYKTLDVYADKIHPDSLMFFVILLGCYMVYMGKKPALNIIGLMLVISAFWFKQAAAVFTLGVVIYQTWRDGLNKAWVYWALAALFGPVLYFAAPESLLGSHFHYYTSDVPSNWIVFDFVTLRRFFVFIFKYYPLLSVFSIFAFLINIIKKQKHISIWAFMIPFAFLNGLLGSLDPESEDNLFLLMSMWFVLGGLLGIKEAFDYVQRFEKKWGHILAVALSFVFVMYNPVNLFVPGAAINAYADLMNRVSKLDGSVYFPWIGRVDNEYEFYPPVQWVAMTDLYRGPGVDLANDAMLFHILEPVLHPKNNAYILTEIPLEQDPALMFLAPAYELINDFESQFELVKPLCAGRFCSGAPRYLYQYVR